MAAIAMRLKKIATINPMMIIGAVNAFILNRSNLPQSEIKICFNLFNNLMNYKQLLYQMNRIYSGYYSIISIRYRNLYENSFYAAIHPVSRDALLRFPRSSVLHI